MKTAGNIIFIIGLLMTLYTGFTYVTREKVVDLGEIEITKEKEHSLNWEPYIGVGVMIVGVGLSMVGRRKSMTN
jgi:hypothetical protein